jgi:hypothetical protein
VFEPTIFTEAPLFDQVAHAMSDSGWLLVALLFGALAAIGWIKREMWIRRRRQQQRKREG